MKLGSVLQLTVAVYSISESLVKLKCTVEKIEVTLSNVVIVNATVAAEWMVEATLVAPVLFGDNVLIEPTDDRLHLCGSSFAEFAGERIAAFRCYFDDSETFDGVPGVTQPLRFTARWSGSP